MWGPLRNSLLLALLSGVAVTTWLLNRPPQILGSVQQALPAPLGYYFRNAVILGTDADGMVSYRVFSALAEHAPEDDDLVLTNVRVEYDAHEEISWLVTAAYAAARSGGDRLDLYGGVRLATLPSDAPDAMLIETQELEFVPDTYLAVASQPVSVARGSARLRSSSMRANLQTDQIHLEDVHGQFGR